MFGFEGFGGLLLNKAKQKVSNFFQTVQGADIYAPLQAFISTARKNNRNVFLKLCHTFEGHNFITSGSW